MTLIDLPGHINWQLDKKKIHSVTASFDLGAEHSQKSECQEDYCFADYGICFVLSD